MNVDLYIDSGAFSAWARGESIDVVKYADFLERNKAHIKGAMNLDVIPGIKGREPSLSERAKAAESGMANYRYMMSRGIDVIPVYHFGEARSVLDEIMSHNPQHIGLGGVARVRDETRVLWLDETFSYLCGSRGYPEPKVHGFGVTSMPLVFRYPWATVDSISWFTYSNYGFGIVPRKGRYDLAPHVVGFSHGSENGKVHKSHLNGDHYDVLGGQMKEDVQAYLKQEGFDPEDLHNDWRVRDLLNIRFFQRAQNCFKFYPFRVGRGRIFSCTSMAGSSKPPEKFDIMFTINISKERSQALTTESAGCRLLSYYYFQMKTPIDIGSYVTTGVIGRKRIKMKD